VWFTDLKFLNADAMEMTGTSNPPHECMSAKSGAAFHEARISSATPAHRKCIMHWRRVMKKTIKKQINK
jgi:hypothetical protein